MVHRLSLLFSRRKPKPTAQLAPECTSPAAVADEQPQRKRKAEVVNDVVKKVFQGLRKLTLNSNTRTRRHEKALPTPCDPVQTADQELDLVFERCLFALVNNAAAPFADAQIHCALQRVNQHAGYDTRLEHHMDLVEEPLPATDAPAAPAYEPLFVWQHAEFPRMHEDAFVAALPPVDPAVESAILRTPLAAGGAYPEDGDDDVFLEDSIFRLWRDIDFAASAENGLLHGETWHKSHTTMWPSAGSTESTQSAKDTQSAGASEGREPVAAHEVGWGLEELFADAGCGQTLEAEPLRSTSQRSSQASTASRVARLVELFEARTPGEDPLGVWWDRSRT